MGRPHGPATQTLSLQGPCSASFVNFQPQGRLHPPAQGWPLTSHSWRPKTQKRHLKERQGGGWLREWMAGMKLKTLPGVFSEAAILAVMGTEVSPPAGFSQVFIKGGKSSNFL